jgi:hypothetical protein
MSILNELHNTRKNIFQAVSKPLSAFAEYPEIEVEFRLKRQGILVEQFQRVVDRVSEQSSTFQLVSDEKTLDITFYDENYKANPNESYSNIRFTLTGGQISEYCRADRFPLKTAIMYKRPIYWRHANDECDEEHKSEKGKNAMEDIIQRNRSACYDSYMDMFDIRCSANVELEMSEKEQRFVLSQLSPLSKVENSDDDNGDESKTTKKTTKEVVYDQMKKNAENSWNSLLEKVGIDMTTFSWSDFYNHPSLLKLKKNFRLKHRKRFQFKIPSVNADEFDTMYVDFTRVKTGKTRLLSNGHEIVEPEASLIDSDIANQEENYEIEIEIVKTTKEKTERTIRELVYNTFYTELLPVVYNAPATTMYSTSEEAYIKTIYSYCLSKYAMELPTTYFQNLVDGLLKNKSSKSLELIIETAQKETKKSSPLNIDLESTYIQQETKRICGLSDKKLKDALDHFTKVSDQLHKGRYSEFISPKVVSIQMNNVRPENVVSIHYNYTVTDKADGISAMLFSIGSSIWDNIIDDYDNFSSNEEMMKWRNWFKTIRAMEDDEIGEDTASDYVDLVGRLLQGTYHLIDSNMQVFPTFLLQSQEVGENRNNSNEDEWRFQLLNGEYMSSAQRTSEMGFMGIYDCYICDDVYMMTSPLDTIRIPSIHKLAGRIPSNRDDVVPVLSIFAKQFWNTSEQSIYEASNRIWSAYRQNQLMDGRSYHLDGLIYTPALAPVGYNPKREFYEPNYGMTWAMNIKWKPEDENTIDFYVTFQKNTVATYNGRTIVVDKIYEKVVNVNGASTIIRYKKAILHNGRSERGGVLYPEEFRPSSEKYNTNGNYEVHLPVTLDAYTGREECMSHDGKRIENDTIIEVGYMNTPSLQYAERWFVLRTRYDKTRQYKKGRNTQKKIYGLLKSLEHSKHRISDVQRRMIGQCIPLEPYTRQSGDIDIRQILHDYRSDSDIPTTINFGNHIDVAKNIWRSIHFPVTENMICLGKDIPEPSEEDQMYYKNDKNAIRQKSLTSGLRDFHNSVVKSELLLGNALEYCRSKFGSNEPLRLIDFTCGKGGDVHKWNQMGLSYVMGVDVFHNNIHDADDGAIVRYKRITDPNKYKADFFVADSSVEWSGKDGQRAFRSDADWKTYKAEMAKGKKFHIATLMFSLHYFFKNADTLNGIMTNIADHLVPGGIVIGVCFDGEKVYRLFEKTKQSRMYEINNQPACMISQDFMKGKERKDIPSTLTDYTKKHGITGIGISVYNYSIQQVIPEYLVERSALNASMRQKGMRSLNASDVENLRQLPISYFTKPVLSDELVELYQFKTSMSDVEKEISYLNQYFFYIHEDEPVYVAKKTTQKTEIPKVVEKPEEVKETKEEKPKKRVSKKAEKPQEIKEAVEEKKVTEVVEEKPKKRVSKKSEKPKDIKEVVEEKKVAEVVEEKPKKRVSKKAVKPEEEKKVVEVEEKKDGIPVEIRDKLVNLHRKIVDIMKKVNFDEPTKQNYIYSNTAKLTEYISYCTRFLEKYDTPLIKADTAFYKLVNEIKYWKDELSKKPSSEQMSDKISDEEFDD